MPPVVTIYSQNPAFVHQGPAFLMWNILRPFFGMRPIVSAGTPLQISDPNTPGTWAASTVEALGDLIVDTNNNLELVTAITSTGETGSVQPTWPTEVGATTVDDDVTWMLVGPSFVWKASTAVETDQQVRAGSGNIWQVIVAGTTGTTVPGDTNVATGGTIVDNTAIWMNLGATIAMGATSGALNFSAGTKQEAIEADQNTAPIDFITTAEDAELDGELYELRPQRLAVAMPNTLYVTGTDPLFPANAQLYEESSFGGQIRVPRPCIGIFSYRRQFGSSLNLSTQPFKWLGAIIYAGGPTSDGKFGISLKKASTYKVSAKGSAVSWRPVGDQIGKVFEQL